MARAGKVHRQGNEGLDLLESYLPLFCWFSSYSEVEGTVDTDSSVEVERMAVVCSVEVDKRTNIHMRVHTM